MFVTVGMCEQAVLAYVKVACLLFVLRTLISLIKTGKLQLAIDCCVRLNQAST